MFTEIEIKEIYNKAYSEFNKKYKINCDVKFVNEEEFMNVAKLSNIVRNNMLEGIPVLVGALVDHEGDKDVILLSVDILNSISAGNKLFVKALIIHEFYHVLFKLKVEKDTLKEDEKSENRVKTAMKKDFPKLANCLI